MSSTTNHIVTIEISWSANTSQNTLVFCVMSSKVRPFAQKWFASAAYTDISNRGKCQALEMIAALKLLIHLRVLQCSHLLMNCKYYICFHDGNRPYLVKGNDVITACMLHMWWNGCLAQLMALMTWHCHPAKCCIGHSNWIFPILMW